MVAVMANRGALVRPYLVKSIGKEVVQHERPASLGLRSSTIQTVRQGLYEVVNNEVGTGKRARLEGSGVAGKTGTAQTPLGRTHAWFCGFAPYEDPKVCIVVLLEHGGKGGVEPAEIARGVFQEAKDEGYI
jgi:cell division protein FtsI/penicillin-binding protein 2